jgi:hypothetical protein
MPIPFTCPYCGEKTLAHEQYAGYEGPCVNCGRSVTIPGNAKDVPLESRPVHRPTHSANPSRIPLLVIGSLSLVVSLVVVATLLISPAIRAARINATRYRCMGHLEQLALALDAYQRDFGSYPPAFALGPDGKPWHSWRVLVLPYLGSDANEMYKRYDLNQAWNSPHNSQLLTSMPDVFASPAEDIARSRFETSYAAVVGPGFAFNGVQPTRTDQIADGRNQTLLLVEVGGAGIPWMQPRDLDSRSLTYTIGTDLGGNHEGGMTAVSADAQGHFLRDTLTPQEVHDLLTIAGGEATNITD